MANLAITARCNRDCSYCFAMDTLEKLDAKTSMMSMEVFDRSLRFLQRSGIDEVRLLGGEPTVHPEFGAMVDLALERGFRIVVFSGGLIPERALDKLAAIPGDRLSVLVNVFDPRDATESDLSRQGDVYGRLGSRVMLGLNIASPAVEPDFMLRLIKLYGLRKRVRLGLAHPILGGENVSLHPRHYPEVGTRVTDFGLRALRDGVTIEFDCGWVPCMFPEGALEMLRKGPDEVGLRCNPILDTMPDGQVISCFPLAPHGTETLSDQETAAGLRSRFETRQRPDRGHMLYQKCVTCDWRARGECTGGCLSASLGRRRSDSFSLTISAGDHGSMKPA